MYDEYKLIIFNDGIGRTCFGESVEETDQVVKVVNPAMIMVSPNEQGQMKVDVIPLFFAEFIEPNKEGKKESIFNFNKNNITVIDVKLTERILEHYFTKINIKKSSEVVTEEVPEVKLFEY